MYLGKLLNIRERFSTRHMEYALTRNFLNNKTNEYGYNRVLGSGGNMYITSNYLINGLGPIKEEEMPFEPNEDRIDISELDNDHINVFSNQYIHLDLYLFLLLLMLLFLIFLGNLLHSLLHILVFLFH